MHTAARAGSAKATGMKIVVPDDVEPGQGSIQLKKNYSAKMHVDKNNYGPLWIIGLGKYQR